MDDRRRHEARAAGILHRHLDAELDGHVANQRRAGDPADALELHRDAVGDPVAVRPQQVVERHDRLVEDERPVAGGPHRGALGVGAARLLERVLEVAGRPQEASRATRREGAVRVGEEHDVGADRVAHGGESLGVGLGSRADLDLEPAIALGHELAGERHRLVEREHGDDVVERDGLAEAGTERLAQRTVRGFGRDVPAGHVERRLDVRLAAHHAVEHGEHGARLRRIEPDEQRRELADTGAGTRRELVAVGGVDHGHLAEARHALVGVEHDDRRVELGRADVAHRVVPAPERLELAERAYAGDLHRPEHTPGREAQLLDPLSSASTSSSHPSKVASKRRPRFSVSSR